MNKVYVLTELVNDYYQHGEYFLGVFKDIPTLEDVNACGAYIVTGKQIGRAHV